MRQMLTRKKRKKNVKTNPRICSSLFKNFNEKKGKTRFLGDEHMLGISSSSDASRNSSDDGKNAETISGIEADASDITTLISFELKPAPKFMQISREEESEGKTNRRGHDRTL